MAAEINDFTSVCANVRRQKAEVAFKLMMLEGFWTCNLDTEKKMDKNIRTIGTPPYVFGYGLNDLVFTKRTQFTAVGTLESGLETLEFLTPNAQAYGLSMYETYYNQVKFIPSLQFDYFENHMTDVTTPDIRCQTTIFALDGEYEHNGKRLFPSEQTIHGVDVKLQTNSRSEVTFLCRRALGDLTFVPHPQADVSNAIYESQVEIINAQKHAISEQIAQISDISTDIDAYKSNSGENQIYLVALKIVSMHNAQFPTSIREQTHRLIGNYRRFIEQILHPFGLCFTNDGNTHKICTKPREYMEDIVGDEIVAAILTDFAELKKLTTEFETSGYHASTTKSLNSDGQGLKNDFAELGALINEVSNWGKTIGKYATGATLLYIATAPWVKQLYTNIYQVIAALARNNQERLLHLMLPILGTAATPFFVSLIPRAVALTAAFCGAPAQTPQHYTQLADRIANVQLTRLYMVTFFLIFHKPMLEVGKIACVVAQHTSDVAILSAQNTANVLKLTNDGLTLARSITSTLGEASDLIQSAYNSAYNYNWNSPQEPTIYHNIPSAPLAITYVPNNLLYNLLAVSWDDHTSTINKFSKIVFEYGEYTAKEFTPYHSKSQWEFSHSLIFNVLGTLFVLFALHVQLTRNVERKKHRQFITTSDDNCTELSCTYLNPIDATTMGNLRDLKVTLKALQENALAINPIRPTYEPDAQTHKASAETLLRLINSDSSSDSDDD